MPQDSTCSISSEGTINLCTPSCDPIIQDCDMGLACDMALMGLEHVGLCLLP